MKYGKCISCKGDDGTLRRCTNEVLCSKCRNLPDYRLITKWKLMKDSCMTEECMEDLEEGRIPNPVYPGFKSCVVYRCCKVKRRLEELGYPAEFISHVTKS